MGRAVSAKTSGTEPPTTVLVTAPGTEAKWESVATAWPEVTQEFCPVGPGFRRRLRLHLRAAGATVVIPRERALLATWRNLAALLTVLTQRSAGVVVLGRDGRTVSPGQAIGDAFDRLPLAARILAQPLLSLVIVLRSPRHLVRDLIVRFAGGADHDDPVVGHGRGKGSGGLVYWLSLVQSARRFGVFGLDHRQYFGVPLSVHSWPAALALLRYAGYRLFTLISIGLVVAALAAVGSTTAVAVLVPAIVLTSTYLSFNIYVGTWELLSWGLGLVGIVSSGVWPVGGGALGLAILAHPGAGALLAPVFVVYAVARHGVIDAALGVTMAAVCSAWFVVPYLRTRTRLLRLQWTKEAARQVSVWSLGTVYQLAGALVGPLIVLVQPRVPVTDLLLFLVYPCVVFYVNTAIAWYFSQYTITNLMLVSFACYCALHPSVALMVWLVLFVNTSPAALFPGCDRTRNFDLTPVRLGRGRKAILELFSNVHGKIGFETSGIGNDPYRYEIAALTYVLAATETELLNGGYAELGDPDVFKSVTRRLNGAVPRAEFEEACRCGFVSTIAVFSDGFRAQCRSRGYPVVGELSGLQLSPYPAQGEPVTVTLFAVRDAGHQDNLWSVVGRNLIRAHAGVRLPLTPFVGWGIEEPAEGGRLIDCTPGMAAEAPGADAVLLRYRYRNYFRRQPLIRPEPAS